MAKPKYSVPMKFYGLNLLPIDIQQLKTISQSEGKPHTELARQFIQGGIQNYSKAS
jgi:hypothetical protein